MIYLFSMHLLILFPFLLPSILCYCHCGRYVKRNNVATSRIYQGKDVLEGRFPWQLYMTLEFVSQSSTNTNYEYYAGAVLISKRHVLTAAHNFYLDQPNEPYGAFNMI